MACGVHSRLPPTGVAIPAGVRSLRSLPDAAESVQSCRQAQARASVDSPIGTTSGIVGQCQSRTEPHLCSGIASVPSVDAATPPVGRSARTTHRCICARGRTTSWWSAKPNGTAISSSKAMRHTRHNRIRSQRPLRHQVSRSGTRTIQSAWRRLQQRHQRRSCAFDPRTRRSCLGIEHSLLRSDRARHEAGVRVQGATDLLLDPSGL